MPVLVSELDLECELWIKLRLAPLPPHVGTISLAFVGQPTVRVQLAPYNRVRLMRIPILQVGLPSLLVKLVSRDACCRRPVKLVSRDAFRRRPDPMTCRKPRLSEQPAACELHGLRVNVSLVLTGHSPACWRCSCLEPCARGCRQPEMV